jgi:hypothetical protein
VTGPYCTGIYVGSLRDAVRLVDENLLGENLVQIVPGDQGCWVILRVTEEQRHWLREHGEAQRPRWTIL